MSITIKQTGLHILNMRTRMPFRYGIAAMTVLPHIFLEIELEIDGYRHTGIASEGLPPKWFTKNPDTSFEDDLAEMLQVIKTACMFARQIRRSDTVFDLWHLIYNKQRQWASSEGYPSLLWSFGVSLVERALIDAFCRASQTPFSTVIHENRMGIDLGEIYPQLAGKQPSDLLPAQPLSSLIVRHTVGLSDPLTEAQISAKERLDDGLPQSLAAAIQAYGLTHFKLKLSGDQTKDLVRLTQIAEVIEQKAGNDYAFTLDGNEQYRRIASFKEFWHTLQAEQQLSGFMRHLLFVEQPLHRDIALNETVCEALQTWDDRPPIIIDESDGQLDSLQTALGCGYAGTSHKNCKGVIKGIANACLIAHLQQTDPSRTYIISGEDLANVGPVALLQDLAVMATLGIRHVERNGHHYFSGLRMLPRQLQEQVLTFHPDLYRRHLQGFPTLNIQHGQIQIGSVITAPFGVGFTLDPTIFTPLAEWSYDTLESDM